MPADQVPGFRGQRHLAGAHGPRGGRQAGDRLAEQHGLPAVALAAQVREGQVARPDADLEGEGERESGQGGRGPSLEGEAALHGPPGQPCRRLRPIAPVPDGQDGVAGELDDIAAVRAHQVDDRAEEGVEVVRQNFGAFGTRFREPLRERGEAGYVSQQDRARKSPR